MRFLPSLPNLFFYFLAEHMAPALLFFLQVVRHNFLKSSRFTAHIHMCEFFFCSNCSCCINVFYSPTETKAAAVFFLSHIAHSFMANTPRRNTHRLRLATFWQLCCRIQNVLNIRCPLNIIQHRKCWEMVVHLICCFWAFATL